MINFVKLVREDMKPALGVTEPGAIAFAVASAYERVGGKVEEVRVSLNSGMYKNAYTCGVPHSDDYGAACAAALGVTAGRAEYGLLSLNKVEKKDDMEARRLVEEGIVRVSMNGMSSVIHIEVTVVTSAGKCHLIIKDTHTNIVRIVVNGITVLDQSTHDSAEEETEDECTKKFKNSSVREMMDAVDKVTLEEISFIEDAFRVNMALFEEGMDSGKTVFIHNLLKKNGGAIFSGDPVKTARLLCAGAIEARVMGLSWPAMSITGSGAHGIIAVMPLYALHKCGGSGRNRDTLLRAAFLSFLITMYMKEYSGRLSAFCGCAIAAGTGAACGITYMLGGGHEHIEMTIRNMASGITGMICDGGNQGCVMKGIVAVDAAFQAAEFSLSGISVDSIHGINGKTPEDTIKNVGKIAFPGMEKTEEIIVNIMGNK